MSVDPLQFRSVMSRWSTGVGIITALDAEGRPVGLTVNSLTSVSLAPPLLLFCLDENSSGVSAFAVGNTFAVHILTADQQELSNRFASKMEDKFEGLAHQPGLGGAPVLADCLALLQCRLREVIPAGDHRIVVGEVESTEEGTGEPLLFYQSRYRQL